MINKLTEIMYESSLIEEIKLYFKSLTDMLGIPDMSTFKVEGKEGYVFRWDFEYCLDDYCPLSKSVEMRKIFEIITSVLEMDYLSSNFSIDFKLDGRLFIRLTPKDSNGDYI
jgi:hypothetical protein